MFKVATDNTFMPLPSISERVSFCRTHGINPEATLRTPNGSVKALDLFEHVRRNWHEVCMERNGENCTENRTLAQVIAQFKPENERFGISLRDVGRTARQLGVDVSELRSFLAGGSWIQREGDHFAMKTGDTFQEPMRQREVLSLRGGDTAPMSEGEREALSEGLGEGAGKGTQEQAGKEQGAKKGGRRVVYFFEGSTGVAKEQEAEREQAKG